MVGETADQIVDTQTNAAAQRQSQGTNAPSKSSKSLTYRQNRAMNIIENQSLTSIATKLHRNFKVKEFYNEIADFSYLKVGKVNGQTLTRDSLLVKMFKSADISHTSSTIANELGDTSDDQPD